MLDLARIHPGQQGSATLLVGEAHTAPEIGSGRVHVLATPVMINLMEAAALDAIEHHGAGRGSWLAMRRVLRCHPWGGHGVDPVPQ